MGCCSVANTSKVGVISVQHKIRTEKQSKIAKYNGMTEGQFKRKIQVDQIVHAPKLHIEDNLLFADRKRNSKQREIELAAKQFQYEDKAAKEEERGKNE